MTAEWMLWLQLEDLSHNGLICEKVFLSFGISSETQRIGNGIEVS